MDPVKKGRMLQYCHTASHDAAYTSVCVRVRDFFRGRRYTGGQIHYNLDSDVEPLRSDLAGAATATMNDLLPVAGMLARILIVKLLTIVALVTRPLRHAVLRRAETAANEAEREPPSVVGHASTSAGTTNRQRREVRDLSMS